MKHWLVALIMYSSLAQGLESEDCAQIENERDRLACFDEHFPRSEPSTTDQIPAVTTEQTGQPQQEQKSSAPSRRWRLGKIFGKRNADTIEGTISAIRIRDRQKMVFQLDNGQIWMQDSPRNLPIRKGDRVTIRSGFIGGFVLRNSSGTSTRVRRID
jgi:hypothetical protein